MSTQPTIPLPIGDDWLSRKQAATFLEKIGCPIAVQTLANMAANGNKGRGPSFTRVRSGIIRYHKRDLHEWAIREVVRVT